MLKVCSHRRSGTHLLMAYLWANFDFGQDLTVESHADGNKWYTGGTNVPVPWGKLFGTHNPNADSVEGTILYIHRNPLECMRSCYEFDGCKGSLNEYATDKRIKYWKDHVEHYCRHYGFVNYESLVTNPISIMHGLKELFNLKKQDIRYKTINNRVGWRAKRKMADREGYSPETIDRFRNIIGEEYRGYRI